MPKRAAQPSVADESAAPGGSAAVDRAMSLLAVFNNARPSLTLSQLAEHARLYKSTVLRLLASLEHARLVLRLSNGRYSLGPEVSRLHTVYAASFSLEALVMPVLRELSSETRESAAFHVQQGDGRLCLFRVDSPQQLRDHARVGDVMPMSRGAGGRVLRAFAGERGEIYERIRRERVAVLRGDRVPEVGGIAAPVFGIAGEVAGAVTLSMPVQRLKPAQASSVLAAATRITRLLGGDFPRGAEANGLESKAEENQLKIRT
jgi:DNA-binding IclR family transcriptional regulator